MKMKRIATALLASTIMMSSLTCMPLAEDTTQTTSQTGVQSTTVTYRQDSTFTVSIPKTITLDSSKTATYNVNVKGDIAGDDIIVVKCQILMENLMLLQLLHNKKQTLQCQI